MKLVWLIFCTSIGAGIGTLCNHSIIGGIVGFIIGLLIMIGSSDGVVDAVGDVFDILD